MKERDRAVFLTKRCFFHILNMIQNLEYINEYINVLYHNREAAKKDTSVAADVTGTPPTHARSADSALTRNLLTQVQYICDDFDHKCYAGTDGDPCRVSFTSHTVRGTLS
ncbi:hypothetical protein [Bradyrhizobium prioriisuperbiae]|uniref:hypothetical protein n=1 Tax=Bradyrhizobium prioriisuperbiae TaxID=2854389 RepID=UPI0028EA1FBE|nr:hypothetical protein [Bradyrhizobium prioritasuperba]